MTTLKEKLSGTNGRITLKEKLDPESKKDKLFNKLINNKSNIINYNADTLFYSKPLSNKTNILILILSILIVILIITFFFGKKIWKKTIKNIKKIYHLLFQQNKKQDIVKEYKEEENENKQPAIEELKNKINKENFDGLRSKEPIINNSNKFCYIGEQNGHRSCISINEGDKCMSGDIFPSMQVCMNPNLRV